MRVILLLHRYLGVVVGLLMALWCLSGFVMMYRGYPRLTETDRLQGLTPLQWGASSSNAPLALPDDARLAGFRIEMLAGRPVLLTLGAGQRRLFDLRTGTGTVVEDVGPGVALQVAEAYAVGHDIAGQPRNLGLIRDDQWTVEGAAGRGLVYHIGFDDPAGTELYVAARNGEAVQITTRSARLWAYLGAIPHWLYPLALRRNAALWDQLVIWSSLAGAFLTVAGAYIGISRFRCHSSGRWSPYRGWFYWHHIAGLAFGALTLTWVASGLFTMNPWGFLDTSVGQREQARLAGKITGADLKYFLAAVPRVARGPLVQLQAAPLDGRLFAMAVSRDGTAGRVNLDGVEQPLTESELKGALMAMGAARPVRLVRMDRQDAYYYDSYQHPVTLPVYREDLADSSSTVLYIDANTGRVVQGLDRIARQSRWLRTGLHDLDFSALLRRRPIWDIVVLLLLAGVTVGCVTGAWMAIQRVSRDVLRVAAVVRGRTGPGPRA